MVILDIWKTLKEKSDRMWLRCPPDVDFDTPIDQIDTSIWFHAYEDGVCIITVNIEIEPANEFRNKNLQYCCVYDYFFDELKREYSVLCQPSNEYPYSECREYDYKRGLYRTKEYLERTNAIAMEIINEMLEEERKK